MTDRRRTALIVGAGPAGLTAALELIRQSDITPILFEELDDVGGISRTVNHNGNRMDIGGHRFFSKSDWVMTWWQEILPVQEGAEAEVEIAYRNQRRTVSLDPAPANPDPDRVFLLRSRLSRIYYLRKFFDYPIRLNLTTVRNLGLLRMARIGFSYVFACLFPRRPERSLEDFLINRFGRVLYRTFFKNYTEKVWGVPCDTISAEWGAQRIKGLSITRALIHAVRRRLVPQSIESQKKTNTSLIERFLYPKHGPGQLWQVVAEKVRQGGGAIHFHHRVVGLTLDGDRVASLRVQDGAGNVREVTGDYVLSTMPVRDLVLGMTPPAPPPVRAICAELPYRDFITVGLLVNRMRMDGPARAGDGAAYPPDNWIYIQESDVRIGRLQIFNNWSPHLVRDKGKVWLGLEYFSNEGDDLWTLPEDEMARLAIDELVKINLIDRDDVVDSRVIRVPKAYPAYFGSYQRFDEVRDFVDRIGNLFLVGRNGMHKYNNQDHSMLTARAAVANILAGRTDKANIWAINTDDSYHEEQGHEAQDK